MKGQFNKEKKRVSYTQRKSRRMAGFFGIPDSTCQRQVSYNGMKKNIVSFIC